MSNNVKVLLVGTGNMGREYNKVLADMNVAYEVAGRSEEGCRKFTEETGKEAVSGGVEAYLSNGQKLPTHAIVAVGSLELAAVTLFLLDAGIKNILVEKPGAANFDELEKIYITAKKAKANVYVAYNRRFYASTEKALEIIKEDGGVTSFHFEFTEWGHRIRAANKRKEALDIWFYSNSSHVYDLAFFLGGFPREMSCYAGGKVDWHESGSIYTGAGISEKGAFFSYCANWAAPGRWSVEIMTEKHRLYLKPLEKLGIQNIGSVKVEEVEIDDRLDQLYKPGIYKETESFLNSITTEQLITIEEQFLHYKDYEKMEEGRN